LFEKKIYKMKVIEIVGVLAVTVVAVSGRARHTEGDTSRPAPWYSCSGKQPGNYLHPYDCTRFIMCDAGLRAFEFDCGECSNRPEVCNPQNRLTYNATVDQCLWADETECHGGLVPTTEDPILEPEPTTPEDSDPKPPKEGDPCNLEDCKNIGDCQSYLRCDKETEKWVEEQCGDEMFWNPENGGVHGGNCDLLKNLSDEVVKRYRSDPSCLACFWEATGECERAYRYQAPNLNNRNVLNLTCSEELVFSQEKLTCQRCSDVRRANGTTCC